ncbi:MAG: ABC transporter substrate-binding protein [Nostoc sp.]|uniref:ABC transporter substrate-binding protein n=1 Tax=Nostoc sp. TaxID=1180 RepID=UPI002FF91D33
MGKLVVFKIGEGNFEQGFPVMLQIGEEGQQSVTEIAGRLPPAPEIPDLYHRWQTAYYSLGGMRIEVPPQITNVSHVDESEYAACALQARLHEWLNQTPIRDLREQVQEEIRQDQPARVILQTQDMLLAKLPWHLWNLFERRPKAEMALSAKYAPPAKPLRYPVRILAILGSSLGINVQQDRALLEQLPRAKITLLSKPRRQELSEQLWNQPWDILYFAGHSSTQEGKGQIQINDTESLPLDEVRYALTCAVQNGLKLAIFNSCDGLGLARSLADLQIPQVIVMREPVPDAVAQAFLRYFLKTFSQGESFFLSVRKAREQLQGMEGDFPCASWLPIIYQNPAEKDANFRWPKSYKMPLVILMLAGLGIVGVLAIAWLFLKPHRTSLGEQILVHGVTNADKEAGAKEFRAHNFVTAKNNFHKSLQQNRNDPEALIYWNNAKVGNGSAFKIAVSVPIGSNPNVAQEILRGVAQAQDEVNRNGGIKGKPLLLEIANDENSPDVSRGLAHEFVEDSQILAVIGHNASDVSVASAKEYQGKLVMISPTSFAKSLTEIGDQKSDNYIFRTVPDIRLVADTLSNYAINKAHKKRIAMCSDFKAVDNKSFRTEFTFSIEQNGGRFIPIPCDFSAPDFNADAVIAQIKKESVDGLLLAPHVDKIDLALAVAHANKRQLTLFGSPTFYTAQTLLSGKADVNGMALAVPWHTSSSCSDRFTNNATKLWGGGTTTVTWRTATAYDATLVIVDGLKKSDGTRTGLQKVLYRYWFEMSGATGKVRFLPSGDRSGGTSLLVKVQPNTQSATGYDFVLVDKNIKSKFTSCKGVSSH